MKEEDHGSFHHRPPSSYLLLDPAYIELNHSAQGLETASDLFRPEQNGPQPAVIADAIGHISGLKMICKVVQISGADRQFSSCRV